MNVEHRNDIQHNDVWHTDFRQNDIRIIFSTMTLWTNTR
jgi:hypothetical protein